MIESFLAPLPAPLEAGREKNLLFFSPLLLLTGQVHREPLKLVADLVGQLARVADDDRADLAVDGVELLEDREHEDGRLAHAGFGLRSFFFWRSGSKKDEGNERGGRKRRGKKEALIAVGRKSSSLLSLSLHLFLLAHLAQDISAQDGLGDALMLDCSVVALI